MSGRSKTFPTSVGVVNHFRRGSYGSRRHLLSDPPLPVAWKVRARRPPKPGHHLCTLLLCWRVVPQSHSRRWSRGAVEPAGPPPKLMLPVVKATAAQRTWSTLESATSSDSGSWLEALTPFYQQQAAPPPRDPAQEPTRVPTSDPSDYKPPQPDQPPVNEPPATPRQPPSLFEEQGLVAALLAALQSYKVQEWLRVLCRMHTS